MKIVQINAVCGKGSTGRIAVDIAETAELLGHECYIAYGHGSSNYHRSYKIGTDIEHLFHNVFYSRLLGLQGYGSRRSTIKLLRWLDYMKPDIVHIHNLHANYLNFDLFFNYLIGHNIPVVFTLHDCLNFTGKCTYTYGCDKWKTKCQICPLIKKSGIPSLFFDQSTKIFLDKSRAYSRLKNYQVICVSQWLRSQTAQSILGYNKSKVDYIYNWINSDIFHPATDNELTDIRKKYDLCKTTKYLISVSQEWILDTIRLEDAISLNTQLPSDYKLILVGQLGKGVTLPDNVIHIPYIASQTELAMIYSVADAYVHFSTQDTFGLVIGEAMACGTIPITYNSSACAEIPGGFGIVVEPRDIKAIIKSLPLIESKSKRKKEMIDYVKLNYNKKSNILKYLDIYQKMVQTSAN